MALMFCVCTLNYAQITYESAFPNINFEFPLEIQNANDNSDRLFVVEQSGRIKVFPNQNDVTSASVSTFLDISDDPVFFISGQEIGLLGLAFHPEFVSNNYFYVYYTTISPSPDVVVRVVLSRFTVSSSNPNLADPNSELILFEFDKNQLESNHNGGKIAFGPDGYLYISIGDGGGANDPQGNAQNTNNIFGSILRIDVDLDSSNPVETNPMLPDGNYEIPSDNPFLASTGLDEIYAYGFRNTWKFSFDQVSGRLWGADVGQGAFEEINIIKNGKNYGWSRFEANSITNSGVTITGPTESPVFFANHNQGDQSITGGYVYRGSEITSLSPDINSKYIYGDYISGRVWSLDYNASTGNANRTELFKTSGEFISSFGVDESGELYFSDYGTNAQLYKLIDGTSPPSGTPVDGIGEWASLNEGISNGIINTIVTAPNGNIYHGGSFNTAGNVTANNIAMWNETLGWQALGSGSNGTISSLSIAPNGDVFAGGSFTEIGGISAQNIAKWDGTSWSALGTGVDGSVAALALRPNGNLYAGGVFETANGSTVRNIAEWNGSQWNALTDATTTIAGTNNEIRSLTLDNDGTLYVGGNFDEAGNITANRIATWNGTNWGTLGTGTSGFVQAIAVTPTDVYIGGNFAIAGGQTVNRVAQWNKNTLSWSPLDNGVNNIINTLIHDGTYLYAGGAFDLANIDTNNSNIVNNIARWSTTEGWEALGTNTSVGVDIKINTLQFATDTDGTDKLFAGGNFSTAGATNANNTARWVSENLLSITSTKDKSIFAYPNPTSGKIFLSEEKAWKFLDLTGKVINEGLSKTLNISKYAEGLYFLKFENGKVLKIIKKSN